MILGIFSGFGQFSSFGLPTGFRPKKERKGEYPPRVALVKGSPSTGTAYAAWVRLLDMGAAPEEIGLLLSALADTAHGEGGWERFEDRLERAERWWVEVPSK